MFDKIFRELRDWSDHLEVLRGQAAASKSENDDVQKVLAHVADSFKLHRATIEAEILELDTFLISETNVQRCENCGDWCNEEFCIECKPKTCWRCHGSGSDPSNQEPSSVGWHIVCRKCGGTGSL